MRPARSAACTGRQKRPGGDVLLVGNLIRAHRERRTGQSAPMRDYRRLLVGLLAAVSIANLVRVAGSVGAADPRLRPEPKRVFGRHGPLWPRNGGHGSTDEPCDRSAAGLRSNVQGLPGLGSVHEACRDADSFAAPGLNDRRIGTASQSHDSVKGIRQLRQM